MGTEELVLDGDLDGDLRAGLALACALRDRDKGLMGCRVLLQRMAEQEAPGDRLVAALPLHAEGLDAEGAIGRQVLGIAQEVALLGVLLEQREQLAIDVPGPVDRLREARHACGIARRGIRIKALAQDEAELVERVDALLLVGGFGIGRIGGRNSLIGRRLVLVPGQRKREPDGLRGRLGAGDGLERLDEAFQVAALPERDGLGDEGVDVRPGLGLGRQPLLIVLGLLLQERDRDRGPGRPGRECREQHQGEAQHKRCQPTHETHHRLHFVTGIETGRPGVALLDTHVLGVDIGLPPV